MDSLEALFAEEGYALPPECVPICSQMCLEYNLKPSSLAAKFCAFAVNSKIKSMSTAALEKFKVLRLEKEKKQVIKTKKKDEKIYTKHNLPTTTKKTTTGGVKDMMDMFGVELSSTPPSSMEVEEEEEGGGERERESTPPPFGGGGEGGESRKRKAVRSPPQAAVRRRMALANAGYGSPIVNKDPSSPCTPSYLSSKKSHDSPYDKRSSSGLSETTFNSNLASVSLKRGELLYKFEIESEDCEENQKPFRFMNESPVVRFNNLANQTQEMGEIIQKTHSLDDSQLFEHPRQHQVTAYGRIISDGKMGLNSMLFEGLNDGAPYRVRLDVSQIPSFVLVRGAVCVIHGKNVTGNKLVAQQIFQANSLPLPSSPLSVLKQYNQAYNPSREAYSVVVAAGPFSTSDNVGFDPLSDLLKICTNTLKPDLLVLLGPILSSDNQKVVNGKLPGITTQNLFQEQLAHLDDFRKYMANVSRRTKVVLMPSARDVDHTFSFPQPPFSPHQLGGGVKGEEEGEGEEVVSVGNPGCFQFNEFQFAATSEDTLMYMSGNTLTRSPQNVKKDRLRSIVETMLKQRSFLPISPPPPSINLNSSELKKTQFTKTSPDVLLLTSNLKPFVKVVEGVLCVNVGKLTRGNSGGTYAHLTLHPYPEDKLKEGEKGGEEKEFPHLACERIKVDVTKI